MTTDIERFVYGIVVAVFRCEEFFVAVGALMESITISEQLRSSVLHLQRAYVIEAAVFNKFQKLVDAFSSDDFMRVIFH